SSSRGVFLELTASVLEHLAGAADAGARVSTVAVVRTGIVELVIAAAAWCVARGADGGVVRQARQKVPAVGHDRGILPGLRHVAVDVGRQALGAARAVALAA